MDRSTYLATTLASTVLLLLPGMALAGPCDEVVEDTLAELRAGAAAPWSDEVEALARAAAGSACVKAASGRYGAEAPAVAQEVVVSTEAAIAPTVDAASAAAAGQEATAETAAADADDGSWNIGGLTVRSLSGSPAKKPYQRQREQNKDD